MVWEGEAGWFIGESNPSAADGRMMGGWWRIVAVHRLLYEPLIEAVAEVTDSRTWLLRGGGDGCRFVGDAFSLRRCRLAP